MIEKRLRIVPRNELSLAKVVSRARPGDYPYSLFLGAGASASSGVLTAKGMINRWQMDLYQSETKTRETPTNAQLQTWIDSNYIMWKEKYYPDENHYGALFSHFHHQPQERQLYIERICDAARPAFGYLYLAGLVASSRFNRILTTNFDDLIADALIRYYDVKPIVCAFDSAVASVRVNSLRPKIIKLHGDFLYDNIRNVRHELRNLDANMEDKLCEMCKDSGLIVIGYGGDDESIIAPLRQMLRQQGYLTMGLHWCLLADDDDCRVQPQLPSKVHELVDNYPDKVSIYCIESFDRLMEECFAECGCDLPPGLARPSEKNPVTEFFEAVCRGSSSNLSPTMNTHLKLFADAALHSEVDPQLELLSAKSDFISGNHAFKQGKFDLSSQHLANGVQTVQKLLDRKSHSHEVAFRALSRLAGLYVARAELFHLQERDDWIEQIQFTLDTVKQCNQLSEGISGDQLALTEIRTPYYNGCCAYALIAEFTGSLSDAQAKSAVEMLSNLRLLDPDGEDLRELTSETGFTKLRLILESLGSTIPAL